MASADDDAQPLRSEAALAASGARGPRAREIAEGLVDPNALRL
jgi:hypothetical protein